MGQYYLRLEAVNIANFIYDTKNLSTIRGGALLLLNAVDRIPTEIESVKLTPLMTGASAGLYEFQAEDLREAKQVCRIVKSYLASQQQLKHSTFVVDILAAKGKTQFNSEHESLIAKNRWQQMQSPTVAVPAQNARFFVEACKLDGIRPGTVESLIPDKKIEFISESVNARQNYGREQKQAFYGEQSGEPISAFFTNNLEELTDDSKQGNLHHKMAVIYLDGNGFGKLKKSKDGGLDRLQEFDNTLKQYRKGMVQNLLHSMALDMNWRTAKGHYRFETLLWGGDELIWIVPAWKAWEVLSFFFDESKNWSFREAERLHHAGGVVLCHHNAPIYRITALARELAELAKVDRDKSLFAYEVLESFDHIGRDLISYRNERCAQPLNPQFEPDLRSLILAGDDMHDILDTFKLIMGKLPRRKLHELVYHLLDKTHAISRTKKREELVGELLDGLNDPVSKDALLKLTPKLGGKEAIWVHLFALWDYLA